MYSKFNFFFPMLILFGFGTAESESQTVYTKNSGTITFFSTAPIEDIKASNISFASYIDIEKGTVSFTVPITGFIFKKSLMQQHFNEQYMESEKFPSAFFEGKFDKSRFSLPMTGKKVKTRVIGNLTIKGITRKINEEIELIISDGRISGICKFNVKLTDYDIKIPRMFVKNIAEVIEVTIDVIYKKNYVE
ncbi:MAG TPA: YceI family protein [Bacteroidales bacterium]|nr:YceI family protein [Bacteroidales bacterium]HBQ81716.1 YceI family protein [Bacteroidales bacterium]